jgi:tRNA threonylcarbamoyladenosine modification (KEOPS) complex  Pcc1 subunit
MNELTVSVQVPEETAKAILKSILPEIDSDGYGRSKVELTYNKELILKISSPDLHALRAAANTYLRWLGMCVKLAE